MNGRMFHPRWGRTILGIFETKPRIRILEVLPRVCENWDQVKELGKKYPKVKIIGVKTGTSTGRGTDNPYYEGEM